MRISPLEAACAVVIAGLLVIAAAVASVRTGPSEASHSEVIRMPVVRGAMPAPLDAYVTAAEIQLPPGTNVYAVRLGDGERKQTVVQAGGGGLARGFWAASSIKVLAAVAALEFAGSLGFSGEATVTFDDDSGVTATLREIYDAAIRDSSNDDYDLLVQIAGLDRLNDEFLTASNGFPETVIQASYAGFDLAVSPAMTFTEDARSVQVPPRVAAEGDYGCRGGNCANLLQLVESVRRVVLHHEIPPAERFTVTPSDLDALVDALRGADGFFDEGATSALGVGTRVYSKPGLAPGRDCVDVAYIEGGGERFLLGVSTPHLDEGEECPSLSTVAYRVLRFLHGS